MKLIPFNDFPKAANNFIAATVKEMEALTIAMNSTASYLSNTARSGQQPSEQWATGRSMYFFCQVCVIVFMN
jgi:hypothetical protein